jgi:hypothetical protein
VNILIWCGFACGVTDGACMRVVMVMVVGGDSACGAC